MRKLSFLYPLSANFTRLIGYDIIEIVTDAKGVVALMMQAYQGYIDDNGVFVADNPSIRLPTKLRAVVSIFYDEPVESVDNRKSRLDAIKQALHDAAESENDLTDADWDELASIRVQTNAGLARKIEL